MTPEPLKQLGKYQLVDILGEGAMGVVYRAHDQVLNRYLAIKVMSSSIMSDERLRERFLREARAAGSLQHPNVVTIYDFGEVEDHLFIAMEFVDGEDLSEIIKRREDMRLATKVGLMIDTLNGLGYAHTRGVVHRDVKPANIRVSTDTRAKVMDFGIAHLADLSKSGLTQTGMMVGTPQYMAPEQISGGEITPASDVFSAGAVLYEFLAYKRPFEGDTLHNILYNVMGVNPPPISELVPSAPAELSAIVAQALAKDPAGRFANAMDMSKALTAVKLPRGTGGLATVAVSTSQHPGLPPVAMRTSQIQSMIATEVARKQRRTMIGAAGAVGAVAAIAALVIVAPWNRGAPPSDSSAAPSNAAAPVTAPPTTAVPAGGGITQAAEQSATSKSAPAPTSPTRGEASKGGESNRAPAGGQGVAAAVATPQPDTLLISARATATSARRRAADEGATATDLAPGDAALRAAEAASAQGRSADAVAQMTSAGTLWADAERAVRARAAAAAAADRQQRGAAPQPVTQTPPVAPPVAPPVDAAPKPPVDARPEIERIIAAYGRALESASIAEIRRAYPGLTNAQQQAWENFFRSVRDFKPTLAIADYSATGSSATVGISAVYAYQNTTNGRAERQELRIQATLSRDAAGAWRLATIR